MSVDERISRAVYIQSVSFIVALATAAVSGCGCLCDEVALLGSAIKETLSK
jgi:hypothetical protein